MNTLKLYENITAILNDYKAESDISSAFVEEFLSNPSKGKKSPIPAIRIICGLIEIQKDCQEEAMKKNGKGSKLNACKSVIRTTSKSRLSGAWFDEDDNFCITDGYRAFRFKEKIDSISMLPDTVTKLDLKKFFNDAKQYRKELDLPTIQELKLYISEQKANGSKIFNFDFGEDKPMVNAKYLLDLLNAFPDAKKMYYEDTLKPLVVYSKDGDALLLPIRKKKH